jgi:TDG/mug DNA glycosylase family protein
LPIVRSFAPIAARSARVLILGSMPGVRSLEAVEYYAHPQNAFWSILGAIFEFDPAASYSARTGILKQRGIGLWDVLRSCDRKGSLDSSIIAESVEVNDFASFLAAHSKIEVVLCNGGTAFAKFERLARPGLADLGRELRTVKLPSTSPANAGMSRARKLVVWRQELRKFR